VSFRVTQERDALPGRPIVTIALAATAIAIVAVGFATSLLENAGRRAPGAKVVRGPMAEQGVVEQSLLERSDRGLELRRRAEAQLSSYGWVDESHRTARIPIERAIDLYVSAHADGGPP
jgi:hypothetical protein